MFLFDVQPLYQSPNVTVALIAACAALGGSILSPILVSAQNEKHRIKQRNEDWARQDQVAADLVKSNLKTMEIARNQGAKLEQIHTLVNSNMTLALQNELAAREGQLITLEELVSLKNKKGNKASQVTLQSIEDFKLKISELRAQLEDRLKQTDIASEQLTKTLGK
jgi:hypothetical protein